ncbi:MAG: hypothetical protein Q4C03_01135 [bacterium]|nr:hypothetical protein [bacterium]MDO5462500.1 hypothetical protein [bacterium]
METWLFEALMLLAFGFSWPASIMKSLRTRYVRGKSPAFMMIILTGYICGITHKVLNPPPETASFLAKNVIWLYVMLFLLVSTDLVLYVLFRKHTEPRQ